MSGTGSLSDLQRRLINRFQGGFPLTPRPFERVAAELGSGEPELLAALQGLLEAGWISRFGPLYNAARMGGDSVLAALQAPDERFDEIADRVNAFADVAHNYRRDHVLNMWFVLSTARGEDVELVARRIEQQTGCPVFLFPKEREFYLGLWLELGTDGICRTRTPDQPARETVARPLDELDRRIVAITQRGLPVVPQPYGKVAEKVGCTTEEVLERFEAMLGSGAVRRFGLIPNHYRLGLRGNGMTVWDVPDEQVAEVGESIGALDFVTHCYTRPRHPPHWPYNLFAMVHGRGRAEVEEKAGDLAQRLHAVSRRHDILFSTAVLKKTGMQVI
jgi:DNA-binding Lrp family transcriptional regulator